MTISFKQFINEEADLALIQNIADNYSRAANKTWTAEEVKVAHVKLNGAKPKDCFNNAYRYMMKNSEATYVLGFLLFHGIPIEHAWVKVGENYFDPTLKSGPADTYVKIVELETASVLKFVLDRGHAPALYDATKIKG